MHREYASGAIIYREEKGKTLYLLIYSGRNGIWGFPKGHIEEEEDELTAARREIFEETGLRDVRLREGFRHEDVYPAVSNRPPHAGETIEKHSIYYLAETPGAAITVDNDEITDYRWVPCGEALALLPFDNMKRILAAAEAFLTPRQPAP